MAMRPVMAASSDEAWSISAGTGGICCPLARSVEVLARRRISSAAGSSARARWRLGVDDGGGEIVALGRSLADLAAQVFCIGLGAGAEHPHPGRRGTQGEGGRGRIVALGVGVGAQHLTLLGTGALTGFLVALHQGPHLIGRHRQAEGVGHRQLRRLRGGRGRRFDGEDVAALDASDGALASEAAGGAALSGCAAGLQAATDRAARASTGTKRFIEVSSRGVFANP